MFVPLWVKSVNVCCIFSGCFCKFIWVQVLEFCHEALKTILFRDSTDAVEPSAELNSSKTDVSSSSEAEGHLLVFKDSTTASTSTQRSTGSSKALNKPSLDTLSSNMWLQEEKSGKRLIYSLLSVCTRLAAVLKDRLTWLWFFFPGKRMYCIYSLSCKVSFL